MTIDREPDMRRIEELLADLRASPPAVPPDLAQRVLADAMKAQSDTPHGRQDRPPFAQVWSRVRGGWPALGGLAAATCAGFWFGVTAPDDSFDPVALFAGPAPEVYAEAAELSGFGWDQQEE